MKNNSSNRRSFPRSCEFRDHYINGESKTYQEATLGSQLLTNSNVLRRKTGAVGFTSFFVGRLVRFLFLAPLIWFGCMNVSMVMFPGRNLSKEELDNLWFREITNGTLERIGPR